MNAVGGPSKADGKLAQRHRAVATTKGHRFQAVPCRWGVSSWSSPCE